MEEIVRELYTVIKDWETFKLEYGKEKILYQCYPEIDGNIIWIKKLDGSLPRSITTNLLGECVLKNLSLFSDRIVVSLRDDTSYTIRPVRVDYRNTSSH